VAGWFATAYGLPQLVLEFVPTAIWPVVMASYAAVFTLDRDRARRLIAHYYKLLFFVAAPFSVGGAILGDRAFLVLYGDAFEPGAAICRIFFVVQCLSFFGTPLSMTLYILEKPWLNLLVWLGAAILNLGLNYVLIPIDWRLGSVLPVSLAVAIMPVVYWLLLRRLGYLVLIPWSFLGRAYLASSSLLLLWPIRGWIDGPWTLLAGAGLALGLVIAGMKLVRVFRPEDAPLVALIPHRGLRRRVAWLGEGIS
jgi:O-antigen/teichoic acid export membrane protein